MITEMGARIYIPSLGRFLSVDPIEGGTPNNYVYPTDPVNDLDLTGQMSTAAKWGIGITVGTGLAVACIFGGCEAAAGSVVAVRAVAVASPTFTRAASWAGRAKSILTRGGAEIKLGSRLRVSPLGLKGAVGKGGVGKNWAARLPHFHYRPSGATSKVMKLHRPWETIFKRWF
ncbi:MAG: RHS repeat-associated core domain-containing protein [Candidatus Saccharibacteria bacterium]